jgi:hypothetical protein
MISVNRCSYQTGTGTANASTTHISILAGKRRAGRPFETLIPVKGDDASSTAAPPAPLPPSPRPLGLYTLACNMPWRFNWRARCLQRWRPPPGCCLDQSH